MKEEGMNVDRSQLDKISEEKLLHLNKGIQANAVYMDWIDDLDWDAQYKNILKEIIHSTFQIGKTVIHIGKIVLELVMKLSKELLKEYPATSMGLLIGAILSALIEAIPFVGVFLGPFLAPILMIVTTGVGFAVDLLEKCRGKVVIATDVMP